MTVSNAVFCTGIALPGATAGDAGAGFVRDLDVQRHPPQLAVQRADDAQPAQKRSVLSPHPMQRQRPGPGRIGRRTGRRGSLRGEVFQRGEHVRRIQPTGRDQLCTIRIAATPGERLHVAAQRGSGGNGRRLTLMPSQSSDRDRPVVAFQIIWKPLARRATTRSRSQRRHVRSAIR